MRYAVLSDVHGNSQALSAVLADVLSVGVDRILCLGDLVGYGPDPAGVLEKAYARINHFVLGNHDAVIAGRLDAAVFNDNARRTIEWTAGQLDPKAAAFLGGFPHALNGNGFRCTHGNPACPAAFGYVLTPDEALAAWDSGPEAIFFIGHSHVPGLFIIGRSGTPHWLVPTDFAAEEGKRYIVNVGSVGYPRDGDMRASYCLFDDSAMEVRFRRVPFDLDGYREALARARVPAQQVPAFLRLAAAARPEPVREMLDFRPLDASRAQSERVSVECLDRVVRSARRWQTGAAVLAVLLLGAVAAAWGLRVRPGPSPGSIEFAARVNRPIPAPPRGATCLSMPQVQGDVSQTACLEDWTVWLRDPSAQAVRVEQDAESGQPVFRLCSSAMLPMGLLARPIVAARGMRFQIQARCRRDRSFAGHAELRLLQQGADGTSRLILHYPIESLSDQSWKYVRKSTPAEGLPQDGLLRWVLEAEFEGELILRTCDLKRTD
ncbi:MAG: metallophosphoesterase family protein [Lentisphaeria bacterium]|nr:metallophosphoesterase family protein [Lentisphaeria bacterium]